VRSRLTKRKEKRTKKKRRERESAFFFLSSKPPPLWLFIPFSNSRVAMPCRACLCVLPCLFSYGLARCDQVCALAGTPPFHDNVLGHNQPSPLSLSLPPSLPPSIAVVLLELRGLTTWRENCSDIYGGV